MTAAQRAANALEAHYDGDHGPGIGVSAVGVLTRAGLAIVDADWVAAATRELRGLLEEFHSHPDRYATARIDATDLTARLNRLAALERGEVPA